jgi:hypothetical protein
MSFILILILIGAQVGGFEPFNAQSGKEWRGIIPLQTNKSEVEKIIGTASDKNVYKGDYGTVFVYYSSDKCKGDIAGWNVPANTVLSFSVYPKTRERFDNLKLDKTKLVETFGHADSIYYTDSDNGIQYTVSHLKGEIISIKYFPANDNMKLRCSGFPPYDAVTETYYPVEKVRSSVWGHAAAKIDSVIPDLLDNSDAVIYVFVYADEQTANKDYNAYLQKIKTHISKKTISPKQIKVLRGGYRDAFEVEIYVLPQNFPAPVATPSLPNKKF